MTNKFEEEYLDVLQNLEITIVYNYENYPDLTDWNVDRVLEALVRAYQRSPTKPAAEEPPSHLTSLLEQNLYRKVRAVCEWRLDRATLIDESSQIFVLDMSPITPEEIIACLKRIRQSVKFWSKEGGRRGYLEFIKKNVK